MNGLWWRIKNNIWSPVFYTQEVLNQNHATDLLHETVDFKNQQDFTAVLVKLQNAYGRKQHNSSHLRLSMKIKETPRAFTAVGVLITHYENNQNKEQKKRKETVSYQ